MTLPPHPHPPAAKTPAAIAAPVAAPVAAPTATNDGGRLKVSPLARKIAAAEGLCGAHVWLMIMALMPARPQGRGRLYAGWV